MNSEAAVFDETYQDYLNRIGEIDLVDTAGRLGLEMQDDGQAVILLLNRTYLASAQGITRADGVRPQLGTCVILSKYLLMCPPEPPAGDDWASYRDFKDSGPLATYWAHEVEGGLVDTFAGRLADLGLAAGKLGGLAPDEDFPYDACYRFESLSRIPMLLLFNDADEEFPAKATVLFAARAEYYLDGECLAMLGAQLSGRLAAVAAS